MAVIGGVVMDAMFTSSNPTIFSCSGTFLPSFAHTRSSCANQVTAGKDSVRVRMLQKQLFQHFVVFQMIVLIGMGSYHLILHIFLLTLL